MPWSMRDGPPHQQLWSILPLNRISVRHIILAGITLLVVSTIYYGLMSEHIPSAALPGYPASRPHAPQHHTPSSTSPQEWARRADSVKQAFLHAYRGYELHAAPHDELKPLTNTSIDNFNGWGVTVYDSLDTMVLMGLNDEFSRALALVQATNFSVIPPLLRGSSRKTVVYVPFFETVIRYLGGLLSAHALSHEPILLERADELGRLLSPAFDTPSGFPRYSVDVVSGQPGGADYGMLAEIATCQLEYTYLARMTGKKAHYDRASKVVDAILHADISYVQEESTQRIITHLTAASASVGGAADSAHEYILKQYLLTAKTDQATLDLYLRTTNHILTNLLYLSSPRSLLYVTDTWAHDKAPTHRFEHLSCFLPGLFALGAHILPSSSLSLSRIKDQSGIPEQLAHYSLPELHMWAARGLTESCWVMYADQPSGLGPEDAYMVPAENGGRWIDELEKWRKEGGHGQPPGTEDKVPLRGKKRSEDYGLKRKEYLLRPETIESMYIMWRTTGEERWRERAWEIFQAIEKEAKTPSGYASLVDVEKSPAQLKDEMPSYFLAETLKYLYLMFQEDDLLPLDQWVFNTEAHPFPVFSWSSWERKKFRMYTKTV